MSKLYRTLFPNFNCFHIYIYIYIYIDESPNQLLFADDTALVADSEEKLCRLVSEFGRVYESIKLRVNIAESSYEVLEVWKWGSYACDL